MEVINYMLVLLREYQMSAYGELDDDYDKRMIAALIELYEQLKPKPDPVGYVKTVGGYPDESEHKVEWVVKHKELKDGQPLYTTPPTREPLSEERLASIIAHGYMYDYTHYDIARAIEQAHGIGATND